jgi:hypothetical protein
MLAASLEDAKITSLAQYLAAVQSTSAILRTKYLFALTAPDFRE